MITTVTLTLRNEDAEPILREAAYNAAKFGALCDHITRKTYDAPTGYGESVDDARKRWQQHFLSAKRIVNSFGFEYEQTSEQETLTVHWPHVGGKRKMRRLPGLGLGLITEIVGSKPDYAHPQPAYRREVHSLACHAAAQRVVRMWRQSLAQEQVAA